MKRPATLKTLLPNCKLEDIFSVDTFDLFYQYLRNKACLKRFGGKKSKLKRADMVAGNATEKKLSFIVISKSKT